MVFPPRYIALLSQQSNQPMENYKPGSVVWEPLTTFVQTDTQTFREIVQRLTGPSGSNNVAREGEASKVAGVRRPTSKFHERRQYMRLKLEIVKPRTTTTNYRLCFSPSKSGSGSFLPNPELGNIGCLSSPVTPTSLSKLSFLDDDKMVESATPVLNSEEEAIKERRFYLLPSPRSRPGYTQPELLTLFPLTSSRLSEKL